MLRMFKLKLVFLLKKPLSEISIHRKLKVNRINVLRNFGFKNVTCMLFVIIVSKHGFES